MTRTEILSMKLVSQSLRLSLASSSIDSTQYLSVSCDCGFQIGGITYTCGFNVIVPKNVDALYSGNLTGGMLMSGAGLSMRSWIACESLT
jgi:hypothetical protein